jgi:Alcohol dehydrogenase GroES-like domain
VPWCSRISARSRSPRFPKPTLEAPGDALVRVTKAAICGSDLHVVHGRIPGMSPGGVIGHEFVGVVEETSASVTRCAEGDRVVGSFTIPCGACCYCERRYFSRCPTSESSGTAHSSAMSRARRRSTFACRAPTLCCTIWTRRRATSNRWSLGRRASDAVERSGAPGGDHLAPHGTRRCGARLRAVPATKGAEGGAHALRAAPLRRAPGAMPEAPFRNGDDGCGQPLKLLRVKLPEPSEVPTPFSKKQPPPKERATTVAFWAAAANSVG